MVFSYILERRNMYGLLIVAIICAGINNVLLHIISAKKVKYNPLIFNALISLVWVVVLFIYNLGWRDSTSQTWLWGIIYGFALIGFIYFKSMAMATGPIALTALIGCGSFVITTLFNALYWKERMGFFEIAGILLMIIAVLLINYKPNDKENKDTPKKNFHWQINCIFFFLFSGATGIIFRFHQSVDKANTDEMMIVAAGLTTIVLLCIFTIGKLVEIKKGKLQVSENNNIVGVDYKRSLVVIILIALGCGVCSCIYNRLNIFNSGVLPSTLFFPVFNGGVVIFSFLSGWLLFKEKPTKLQFFGAFIGVVAILLVSRLFGVF
jgi:drug/metabolite transporter (DMT)-like permease